jgi:FdhD protein
MSDFAPPVTRPGRDVVVNRMAVRPGGIRESEDRVAVEEPLEIRVGGRALAVVMRTPGDDPALAAGFLLTEGLIRGAEDIERVAHCTDVPPEAMSNVIDVTLARGVPDPLERGRRNFYASSSCGICGKGSIEEVRLQAAPLPSGATIAPDALPRLMPALRSAQVTFERTGGLHAAGLFRFDGTLVATAEDVGRHNAVDKIVGGRLLQGDWPQPDRLLLVSGRVGFEIVQKAWLAGIPAIAAVSAPTSLAVELAREARMTLLGFLRGEDYNVYAGSERLGLGAMGRGASH